MPEKSLSALEELVGQSVTTVDDFPVTAVKIVEVAEAVRDENPLYRDSDLASARGYDAVPAPLPFAWSGSVRPTYGPPDRAWPGFDFGFDWSRVLHGEERFSYQRPVVAGDHLTGTSTVTDVSQREGKRGGTMTFVEFETVFRDENDDPVVTEETTLIELAEGQTSDGGGEKADVSLESERETADRVRTVQDVNRVDFVEWAGAVGDFARVHIDEPYAREAGYETVFGPGMLTMAHASVLVSDWAEISDVIAFEARFTGILFPSDTLTILGSVGEERTQNGKPVRDLTLSVRKQDGSEIMTGTATARQ